MTDIKQIITTATDHIMMDAHKHSGDPRLLKNMVTMRICNAVSETVTYVIEEIRKPLDDETQPPELFPRS